MKKKWLSLATVLCFGVGLVSGCKNDGSKFETLNIDGHDIVLTVGDTKYTADELFAEMLNSQTGAEEAYKKILKMMVENVIETDSNMEASWELMLDSFEEDVETKALNDGISEDEAREALLKEDGYASIEEKKNTYLYEVKLAKFQENYWKERKDYYLKKYLEERLPYYVKHVLVKTGYSSARGPYSSVIDSDDAKDLYDVYSLLLKGEKFSYIMNHKSEDTGSTDGKGYHMDLTTSFVTEFLHGVFVVDSLMKNKQAEVQGLSSEVLSYYLNESVTAGENNYNFNVIYASDIENLGKTATSSDYNSISTYEKNGEGEDVSFGSLSNSKEYGSTSALYSRTVIFNQTFNNAGVSVIAYDLDEEIPTGNYIEMTIDGKKQKLLTDEKGNLVFIACAKGSSSDLWVHFLTVDVSPFDQNLELFYSFDQEKTIEKMVEAKRTELKLNSALTDADINTQLDAYKEELEAYQTYVDIKGGESQKSRNQIIEELEGYVKTYAKRGITSEAVAGEDQFLSYDMLEYYMEKGDVEIKDATIKTLVENYIANQKALIDLKVNNSIAKGWDEYYDRVVLSNSDEINNKKIPMECAYALNAGAVCSFNYDEENGFKINITYKNVGDNNAYLPTDKTTYVSSFKIGDGVITLPGVGTDDTNGMHRTGYTFAGWYSTSTFDEGTEVTSIDATRSSSNNKVVLYAKWVEAAQGGSN